MPSPADAPGGVDGGVGVLAVVGDLVEDIVVWADEPLRVATDTAARIFRARGGSAANVAALSSSHQQDRLDNLHPRRCQHAAEDHVNEH